MQFIHHSRRQPLHYMPIFTDPAEEKVQTTTLRMARNVRDELPASMRGNVWLPVERPNPAEIPGKPVPFFMVQPPRPQLPVRALEGKVWRTPMPPTGLASNPVVRPTRAVPVYPRQDVLNGRVWRLLGSPPPTFVVPLVGDYVKFAPRPPRFVMDGRVWLGRAYPSGLSAVSVDTGPPLRGDESGSFGTRPDPESDSAVLDSDYSDTVALRPVE